MKTLKIFGLVLCITLLAGGCKKDATEPEALEQETAAEIENIESTPTPAPEQEIPIIEPELFEKETIPEGMMRSYLTGEYVPVEIGTRRPAAVMINNVKAALPSSSLSKAGVIYEAPVEGALTRLMPIFEEYDNLEKIGSVRSCRDYFLDYAMGFDCIYVHFGQAVYALHYLESDVISNLSGLAGYADKVFYRTTDRQSPHNAYTSGEGITRGIEHQGYRTQIRPDYDPQFTFAKIGEEVVLTNGSDATLVKPGYLFNDPWFEYNEKDGLYYRFQYGSEQIDEYFNTQLAVKNIIIQYTKWENYDENGYLNLYSDYGGKMQYITNGKVIDGTWEREHEWWSETYYDSDGNEITLNTGKTWICVVLDSNMDDVKIS